MSSLPDRRNSPRRRAGSSMHPGWAVFLMAWGSGFLSLMGMLTWIYWMQGRSDLLTWAVPAAIALALFIAAGRRAEKLTDHR